MPAYVTLPGTSGNYFSTSDVNLLDANSAHFEQALSEGAGPYGIWGRSGTSTLGPSTDLTPVFGTQHIHTTLPTSAGLTGFSNNGNRIAVNPSTQYTFSAYVSRDTAADVNLTILDYNAGGSAISTLINSTESMNAGEWTILTGTFTTSGTAATLRIDVRANVSTAGQELYMDAACLRTGTDGTFVPSLRIVGDIEAEWKVALDDYTPTNNQVVVSTFDQTGAVDGYQFGFDTSGQIFLRHGSGSNARAESSTATGLSDGTAHVFKVTIDVSTGAVVYYIDGVQHDTDTMPTGAASPNPSDLYVGSTNVPSLYLDGDLYYVILRDGIDGPILARFDADDWVGI